MDWLHWIWIGLLAVFAIMMIPQAMRVSKEAPKGSMQDWMGFVVPVLFVVGFIILLIALV